MIPWGEFGFRPVPGSFRSRSRYVANERSIRHVLRLQTQQDHAQGVLTGLSQGALRARYSQGGFMRNAELVRTLRRNSTERLNQRQRQVLVFLCKGLRNAEIGQQLDITERTVKAYISQLFLIFDVTNRSELVGLMATSMLDQRITQLLSTQ